MERDELEGMADRITKLAAAFPWAVTHDVRLAVFGRAIPAAFSFAAEVRGTATVASTTYVFFFLCS